MMMEKLIYSLCGCFFWHDGDYSGGRHGGLRTLNALYRAQRSVDGIGIGIGIGFLCGRVFRWRHFWAFCQLLMRKR